MLTHSADGFLFYNDLQLVYLFGMWAINYSIVLAFKGRFMQKQEFSNLLLSKKKKNKENKKDNSELLLINYDCILQKWIHSASVAFMDRCPYPQTMPLLIIKWPDQANWWINKKMPSALSCRQKVPGISPFRTQNLSGLSTMHINICIVMLMLTLIDS
jgi:hypothetical protein